MIIPSNYEINIAIRMSQPGWDGKPQYVHYARVELGDVSEVEAKIKFENFCRLFPKGEYQLTLNHIVCHGYIEANQ